MTVLSPHFRFGKLILSAVLIAVFAGAVPDVIRAETPAADSTREATVASVSVAYVVPAQMIGQVAISGTLVAKEEILVYPQVTGSTIDTLLVDIGDRVVKDQVLARLNNSTLTAQLAQARAEFARAKASVSQARNQIISAKASKTQAEAVLERATAMRKNGAGTQATLDQAVANAQTAAASVASANDGLLVAEAQQQQARASLDIADLNLERATLRAPADGLISARNGQVGGIATSSGEPIFRIIRDGKIEVKAEVIETALGTISIDDPANLRIAGNGDVTGTVRQISPTVDERNRLGTIRIEIADNNSLRTGVFTSGEITTVERNSLTVPTTAVLTDGAGTFVLVVAQGRLERRAVTVGLIWDGKREIINGLKAQEVVVARAGAFFGNGDRINPIFPQTTATQQASE
ncbi:MAG: HlyD family secretion protein [Sulfitobacter sp.]|jgi:HlyD family secretion protein